VQTSPGSTSQIACRITEGREGKRGLVGNALLYEKKRK
jgi:hypothetical protein